MGCYCYPHCRSMTNQDIGRAPTSKPSWWIFLIFAALSSLCCSKDAQVDLPSRPYSFFTAGHVSGNPANWHRGFHQPFLNRLHLINNDSTIEFGFLLGDLVKKGSVENFDALDRDLSKINKKVYIVAGNHDVNDRSLFDSRYGPSVQSFTHQNDLFIILDTNLDGWNISGEQLHFLMASITAQANCKRIFIMMHHLLWWTRDNKFKNIRINSSTGRAPHINFYDELMPFFKDQNKPIYLYAGDVGAQATGSEFMYYQEDEVTFIATGMGGGQRDNFVVTTITSEGEVQFKLKALNGNDVDALGELEDYRLPQ